MSALLADARVDPNQEDKDVSRLSSARCLLDWPCLSYDIVGCNVSRHSTESSPTGPYSAHLPGHRHAQGHTLLYMAADKGHEACVSTLLADARVDPNQADKWASRLSSARCLLD